MKSSLKNATISPLISESEIQEKIKELARKIYDDYRKLAQENGFRLILVGVLNGAIQFVADLARELSEYFPSSSIEIDFVSISTRRQGTAVGKLVLEKDTKYPLSKAHVLVVDDILDTGKTLSWLTNYILNSKKHKGILSLKTCVLLVKSSAQEKKIRPDYFGFLIPDVWVVGYGLDIAGKYRQLKDISRIYNHAQ